MPGWTPGTNADRLPLNNLRSRHRARSQRTRITGHVHRAVRVSGNAAAVFGDLHNNTYNTVVAPTPAIIRQAMRTRIESGRIGSRRTSSWMLPWLIATTSDKIRWTSSTGPELEFFWRISVLGIFMIYIRLVIEGEESLRLIRPSYRHVVPSKSPMLTAVQKGDIGTLRRLLHNKEGSPADITADNLSPLYFAIENGHISVVDELLRCGADPNGTFGSHDTSPLAWALNKRNDSIVRSLLRAGADTQVVSRRGWSILFYLWTDSKTLLPSCKSLFELLAIQDPLLIKLDKHGLTDDHEWSLLSRAASAGTKDEVEYMIRHGADVQRKNSFGWSAIFEAVYCNRLPTVELLASADPSLLQSRDVRGWTLLHIAAGCGHEEVIKFLLANGGDSEAKSHPYWADVPVTLQGQACTPIDVAFSRGAEPGRQFLNIIDETLGGVFAEQGSECFSEGASGQ